MNIPKLSLCLLAMFGTMHVHARNIEVFNGSSYNTEVAPIQIDKKTKEIYRSTKINDMEGKVPVYEIKPHHKITIPLPEYSSKNDIVLLFCRGDFPTIKGLLEYDLDSALSHISYYYIGKKDGKIFIGPFSKASTMIKGLVLFDNEYEWLTIYPTFDAMILAEKRALRDNAHYVGPVPVHAGPLSANINSWKQDSQNSTAIVDLNKPKPISSLEAYYKQQEALE